MVKRVMKSVLWLSILAVCVWLLTLGIFVRRSVRRTLSSRAIIQTTGNEKIDVRVHVVEYHQSSAGVPYFYYRIEDEPRYGVATIFNSTGASIEKIILDSLVVGELTNAIASPIELEPYTPPLGSTIVFRKTFPDVFSEPDEQNVYLRGWILTSDGTEVPFHQSIKMPFERDTQSTVGWMQLLYYGQF